ncbi:MAG: PAS domain S-box protein [Thermodesulfobacteriota bacterium]
MKLQTKVILIVLPLVLVSVFVTGAWSIKAAEVSVRRSAFLYLETQLDSFISDHTARLEKLLAEGGGHDFKSFAAEYKKQALEAAGRLRIKEKGCLLILNEAGYLVFCSGKKEPDLAEALWGPLALKVGTGPEGTTDLGRLDAGPGRFLYAARRFKPWGWVLFAALPEEQAFAEHKTIRGAIIGMALLCGLAAVLLVFRVLQVFFVRPVAALERAAAKIARGGPVEQIGVRSRDELGALAAGMETMARSIKEHRSQQESWRKHLEDEVRRRTQDLEEANLALRQEIEERKKADAALKAGESKYRSLFDHMTSGFAYNQIILDRRGGPADFVFLEVNRNFEELTGLKAGQVVGRRISQLLPWVQEEHLDWIQTCGQVALSGIEVRFEQYLPLLKRWFAISAYSPKKGFFAMVFEDITPRKKTEAELNLLSTAIGQSAESVSITDAEGLLQYMNPAFERLTGYSREEALGRPSSFMVEGRDKAAYGELRSTIIRDEVWKGHLTNQHKNGSLYEVEMTVSPVRDSGDRITNYVVIKRDVTRERSLEKQLRQAQKMEALGALAGGIAHDFNNILGAILGYTQLALLDAGEGSGQHRHLSQVLQAGHRAAQLVRHILAFSRQTEQELRPVQAAPLVKEAFKLLRATLPSTIMMEHHLGPEEGSILGDPTQIHQILMNFCTNSAQAMGEGGGRLTIRLEDVEVGRDLARNNPELNPGRYLRLSVTDTGPGVPPAIRDRIFEPYFTAKAPGQGTGLGLAIVHGIVRSHKGVLTVDSEPRGGAEFSVWFPKIEEEQETENILGFPWEKGTGRILFVDDEKPLVDLGKNLLERLGYEVVPRTDSLEALDLFRSAPDRFDLIITDQTMPHLTGTKLAQEVLRLRPDMPVILCTGFSQTITPEKAGSLGIKGFLYKPMVMGEITRTIRQALDGRPHPQGSPVVARPIPWPDPIPVAAAATRK